MRSDSFVSSPSVVRSAVQANLRLLAQGIELVGRTSPETYAWKMRDCFNSSMGGHFRHVIEHYQGLLNAVAGGELDYETRARDSRVESDPEHALAVAGRIETRLNELGESTVSDRTLRMVAETAEGAWLDTSLGRELEFLVSHTVHHYALMAVIAGCHDIALPADFGMAPSTLKYQQSETSPCAH